MRKILLNDEEKKLRKEVPERAYEIFTDGKFNCRFPKDFNLLTGYATPPMSQSFKRLHQTIEMSMAKINGQHLAQ